MKEKNRNFERMVIFAMVTMIYLSTLTVLSTPSSDELGEREEIELMIMDSPPTPPVDVSSSIVNASPKSTVILSNVPTSRWTQGCSATSAGMIFGYYDRTGYSNMYTGPANGGVCPLFELGQGVPGDSGYPFAGSCSIIVTAQGFDGRVIRGHTDDYWISYGNPGPDPWVVNGWTEHTWGDCTTDFMGTNQWKWDYQNNDGIIDFNKDGSTCLWTYSGNTKLYDYIPPASCGLPQTSLAHGMRLFAESRGYAVVFSGGNYQVYTQKTDNQVAGGFSFIDFQNEIDNGYPVMVQVTGHSMVGMGYDASTSPPTIYIHDTWGNYVASMQWGGSYSGMDLEAITVIHLNPSGNAPPMPSSESPSNGTAGVSTSISQLSVYIDDPENNSFDWTIETVPNIGSSSGTGETDGTKTCSISGLNYAMTYTWYVNATDSLPDGSDTYTRAVYTFTTEFETEPPEITNIDAQPDPQVAGGSVNVTCNVIDNVAVNVVKVNVTDPNGSSVNVTIFEGSYYYNTTYTIAGTYNYFIWANDTSNNINISTAYQFEIVSGTITVDIPLDTGWNLITIPVENSYTAITLSENITNCTMISWFDAVNQTYKTYYVGGPSVFDFPIIDGYGYFTLVNENSTLSVSGLPIASVSVDLSIGWNMIGWYHEYDTTAISISENITNCTMISWFDAVNETFKTYYVGGPSAFDFAVRPGMGLFILVDKESTWQGEG